MKHNTNATARSKTTPRRPARTKMVVELTVPPETIEGPDGFEIIHPVLQEFIDYLVERYLADVRAGRISLPERKGEPEPENPSRVITVDEAVNRYGMNREEIIGRFVEAARTNSRIVRSGDEEK